MTDAEVIEYVAGKVGTSPQWLDAVINFETGGTYDPLKKNPLSSAIGLIQLTNAAAKEIFKAADSASVVSKYPTFESQMINVVLPYLQQRATVYNGGAPLDSPQKLYMSIFYPSFIDNEPDTVFPKWVQDVNPGIVTISDYVNKANARIKSATLKILPKAAALLPLVLLAVGFLLWRK